MLGGGDFRRGDYRLVGFQSAGESRALSFVAYWKAGTCHYAAWMGDVVFSIQGWVFFEVVKSWVNFRGLTGQLGLKHNI